MYSMISENAISAIKTIFWDRYADATLTKWNPAFFLKKAGLLIYQSYSFKGLNQRYPKQSQVPKLNFNSETKNIYSWRFGEISTRSFNIFRNQYFLTMQQKFERLWFYFIFIFSSPNLLNNLLLIWIPLT